MTPALVAAIITSSVAILVNAISLMVTSHHARKQREQAENQHRRDENWRRFEKALDLVASTDSRHQTIGWGMLDRQLELGTIRGEDAAMLTEIAIEAARETPEPIEEAMLEENESEADTVDLDDLEDLEGGRRG